MKRRAVLAAGAAVVLATAALLAWQTTRPARLPDLALETIDGRKLHLHGMAPAVLVNFWASSCRPCMEELPHLARLYEQLRPRGLEVIGVAVSYDPPIQVVHTAKVRRIPYPVVSDVTGSIARGFGMRRPATPVFFLLDGRGNVVDQFFGRPDWQALRRQIDRLLDRTPARGHGRPFRPSIAHAIDGS